MIETEQETTAASDITGNFERLRAIRKQLRALASHRAIAFAAQFDPGLGFFYFIVSMATGALNAVIMYSGVASHTPASSWFMNWFQTSWVSAASSTNIQLIPDIAIPIGLLLVIVILRIIVFVSTRKRLKSILIRKLEKSNIVGRVIESWEEIPDIIQYTAAWMRPFILWPRAFLVPPKSDVLSVTILVENLDWYLRPPTRLFRWRWLYSVMLIVSGVTAEIAGIRFTMSGYEYFQSLTSYPFLVLLAVGAAFVYVLTCAAPIFAPTLSDSEKAQLLLNKLKPVFDLLDSQPGKP